MSETVEKHKAETIARLNFAIITCSTSRYKELLSTKRRNDYSGELISQILKSKGHQVTLWKIVSDDKSQIQRALLKALKSRKNNVIITCGGTGFSQRDVTIEAAKQLIEKEVPGFGELFRSLSYKIIGTASILTRAFAGTIGKKIVFCLPGSPQSVTLALKEIIIPEVGHIIKHLQNN
jgi:molybdenum cofactor biosynthesis protein B